MPDPLSFRFPPVIAAKVIEIADRETEGQMTPVVLEAVEEYIARYEEEKNNGNPLPVFGTRPVQLEEDNDA